MAETLKFTVPAALDIEQYFGLWAVEPAKFRQMLAHIQRTDLVAHAAAHADEDVAAPNSEVVAQGDVESQTTIAIIGITGTLTKRGSSFSSAGAMSYIRREIRNAANDKAIDAILLVVDSPGGTVAGTADLASEVSAAAAKKPVYAQIEDQACSAAYWIACQCDKVFANDRTALIGSIGTYMGLYDESEHYKADGVRPVLVSTGEYKGAGFPGAEITEGHEAYFQEIIDQTQQSFAAAVEGGRSLSSEDVAKLATGRTWLADEAQKHKLIDGIQSLDETLSQLATEASKSRGTMATTQTDSKADVKQAATIQQLRAACPGASANFLVSQLEAGASVDDARNAWILTMSQKLQKLESRKSKKRGRRRAMDPDDEDMEEEEEPESEEDEEPESEGDEDDPESEGDEEEPESEEDEEEPESEEDEEEEPSSRRHRGRRRAVASRKGGGKYRKPRRAVVSKPPRKPGVNPLGNRGGSRRDVSGNPADEWRQLIDEKIQSGMQRAAAVASVAKENPELREAYVQSYNVANKSRRK